MNRILLMVVLVGLCCAGAWAGESGIEVPKFKASANPASAGFFWVDTSTGMTWVLDAANVTWRYVGQPEGAKSSPDGTYMPLENRSGPGVFILNVTTGEGWWTDGTKWKLLGIPKLK
jgi:hypothetical protein